LQHCSRFCVCDLKWSLNILATSPSSQTMMRHVPASGQPPPGSSQAAYNPALAAQTPPPRFVTPQRAYPNTPGGPHASPYHQVSHLRATMRLAYHEP
jgi:hypothetical protein